MWGFELAFASLYVFLVPTCAQGCSFSHFLCVYACALLRTACTQGLSLSDGFLRATTVSLYLYTWLLLFLFLVPEAVKNIAEIIGNSLKNILKAIVLCRPPCPHARKGQRRVQRRRVQHHTGNKFDTILKKVEAIFGLPCLLFLVFVFGSMHMVANRSTDTGVLVDNTVETVRTNDIGRDNAANVHEALDPDKHGTISLNDTVENMKSVHSAPNGDGALPYADLHVHGAVAADFIHGTTLDSVDDTIDAADNVKDHAYDAADVSGHGVIYCYELVLCACSFVVTWFFTSCYYHGKFLKQQRVSGERDDELDRQKERLQRNLKELDGRKCAFCHAALATAVNKPCGCRLLCRECSDDFRVRNGNVCPNPNCCKTQNTTIEDDCDKSTMVCIICAENWESNCIFKVSEGCDHLICIACMVTNVKVALRDRSLFDAEGLKCPMPQCTHHVKNKIHQMKDIAKQTLPDPAFRTDAVPLTDDECEQYLCFMQEASIPVERRIWCKNPACGQHAMPMDVGEGRYQTPSKFVCMFCESEAYALCTQCKELHHPGTGDCKRAMTWRGTNSKSDTLIKLTSKPCPYCTTPTTHFHGHGCHHIMPDGGCPSCHKHWCFACRTACQTQVGNNYCASKPRCSMFCKSEDIERNIDVSSGYPIDRRCSCPICPECRLGRPCAVCSGDCVVCKGLVFPGKMVAAAMAPAKRTHRSRRS